MDSVFHALAHGARRDMLGRLAGREMTVGELAEPLASAAAWLRFYERYWTERLDALEELFRTDTDQEDR